MLAPPCVCVNLCVQLFACAAARGLFACFWSNCSEVPLSRPNKEAFSFPFSSNSIHSNHQHINQRGEAELNRNTPAHLSTSSFTWSESKSRSSQMQSTKINLSDMFTWLQGTFMDPTRLWRRQGLGCECDWLKNNVYNSLCAYLVTDVLLTEIIVNLCLLVYICNPFCTVFSV